MSILDLASMVLAPTAVKDGKVYNAIPNDQDFTFSRGTEATRVNSAGLIEKARTNFLTQSNTFNTTWNLENLTVTSGQSGYDGSSDAWKVTPSIDDTYHRLTNAVTGASNSVVTLSVYAKADGYNYIRVSENATTGDYATFNLSTGIVENNTSLDAKIEDIGNGWYRCSSTIIPAATHRFDMYVMETATVQQPWAGNGTSGILIQSAQLEQGLVSTDYIPTTTSSVTVGITDDLPRVDYSGGGCPSLLLEPSRTQLLPYSEYFGIDWNFQQLSVTSNVITSPEGVINASKLIEDSSNNRHIMYDPLSSSSGTTYTFSIFAKSAERSFLTMRLDSDTPVINTWFNLSDGSIGTSQGGSPTIKDMGNGWYRCSVQYTSTGGIIYSVAGVAITDGNLNYQGNGTSGIYIYGAMLEAGSYSTSYIPSYGTSTSRSADSCSLTNASNLIGQSEGTLFFQLKDTNNLTAYLGVDNGSTGTRILIYGINDQKIYTQVRNSGTVIFSASSSVISGGVKVAVSFDSSGSVFYVNGVQVSTGSGTTYTNLSQVTFNHSSQIGVKIKQAILFPTRLTNDQLAELTK